jgi:hypothetical protein
MNSLQQNVSAQKNQLLKFAFANLFKNGMALFASALLLLAAHSSVHAQKIADRILEAGDVFEQLESSALLLRAQDRTIHTESVAETVADASFFTLQTSALQQVLSREPSHLMLELESSSGQSIRLLLMKSNVLSQGFQVLLASSPEEPMAYTPGLVYWGIIEGATNSLAALYLTEDEIMGVLQDDQQSYTLGKIENSAQGVHMLYANKEMLELPGLSCHVDDTEHYIGTDNKVPADGSRNSKCVRVYVEVDYDIVVGKGGVTQATNYVLGAFSQVSILYANDDIELVISEMKVWDVTDPYTGPSTSNYLTQFRNYQNGNYNGDIAHLVGYAGGGGIAYLDVLCNSFYAVGYSAINATYNNVPTYSWTVMVLAHEIGHNLGSQHTHACAWNGNNTAIDGCGPAAGYSEGCNGPIPSGGGTIMSYCHLNSVGINLNLGFGPQPGDRMRGKIANAPCLGSCAPPVQLDAGITEIVQPEEFPCNNNIQPVVRLENFGATTLTSVSIEYQVSGQSAASYNWTGSLNQGGAVFVTLPTITYSPGSYTFTASTSQPNGQQDENTANDGSSTSFTYIEGFCDCIEATGALQPNPLTHSGGGSSTSSLSLLPGSKNANFQISGMSFKNNGPQQTRFDDRVTVSYQDGNGNTQVYGIFLGSQQSSVNVQINGMLNGITVSLSNGLNNNYNGTLSISFSAVDYCGTGEEPCSDSDQDGVCDEDDICPGFDDNLIGTACDDGNPCTSNDVYTTNCLCEGTPIPGCGEGGNCDEITSNFPLNPLTHQGSGSSSTSVSFPAGNQDVSFTISDMDARLSGNPSQRYNDQVTVTYVDGNGNTQTYGTFLGSQQGSVNVQISGAVQSVTVNLSNGNGANSVLLSISLSPISFCLEQAPAFGASSGNTALEALRLFPNPTAGNLYLQMDEAITAEVVLYSPEGIVLGSYRMVEQALLQMDLTQIPTRHQLIFVSILAEGRDPVVRSVVISR